MENSKVLFITGTDTALPDWINRSKKVGMDVNHMLLDAEALPSNLPDDISTVVEWVSHSAGQKQRVLRALDALLPLDCLILSAAHETMCTTMATWIKGPQRLLGFSPLGCYSDRKTLSLTAPAQCTAENRQAGQRFFEALGLKPCWIVDTPGMVLGRIYAMLTNEAAFALQENIATAEDIDTAMRLGTNYPLGPLAWADQVGLDVVLNILNLLCDTYKEERYRPCLMLQKMVAIGQTGKKAGQGFYAYPQKTEGSKPNYTDKEQVKAPL